MLPCKSLTIHLFNAGSGNYTRSDGQLTRSPRARWRITPITKTIDAPFQQWLVPECRHLLGKMFDRLNWRDGRALTVVEIGSYERQSTLWTIANLLRHPDSRIHCIDHFAGEIEHGPDIGKSLRTRFDANVAQSADAAKAHVHQNLSRDGLMTLRQQGVQADFIYIDGSQQGLDVLEDLVLSFRLLKVGGIILYDDYLWFMEG
jgi:hypothetical protein